MRVTVRKIASQTGVSPATVSLVLNNKPGVSQETRRKVQQALDQHGYRLSQPKRRRPSFRLMVLKYRDHGMGVEENQGFIASIIDQIEQECRRLSFHLVMVNCNAQNAQATLAQINADPPDGMILVATELTPPDYGLLEGLRAPLVVLDNSMQFEKWDSVVMDNEAIAMTAVQHLYDLGHRQIGYFKSSRQINNLDERYAGYLAALARLGLTPPPPVLLTLTLGGAYRDMKQLLEEGKYRPAGAVMADNDSVAIGAAKAIQEAGFTIPGDISIIGVDDIPFSAMTTPALSTIRISRSTLGTMAVDLIQKRMANPAWPPLHLRIVGNLICRASTRQAQREG